MKEVKDLYSENSKTLMKAIENNTNKWKATTCSGNGRTNVAKMSKMIYRFNASLIKTPMFYFPQKKNKQPTLKFTWSHKRT